MFKGIKLLSTIFILLGPAHVSHCSALLDHWDSNKENKDTTNTRNVAAPYFPTEVEPLLDIEPSLTLNLFLGHPSSAAHYSSIKSIAIQCSNGQIVETSDWQMGAWLPFVKFGTNERMGLHIKASDCPVTLTMSCLSTFYLLKNIRKRKCKDPGKFLSDYRPWREEATQFIFALDDLFDEDGNPLYSCLCFRSSSPALDDVNCEMM